MEEVQLYGRLSNQALPYISLIFAQSFAATCTCDHQDTISDERDQIRYRLAIAVGHINNIDKAILSAVSDYRTSFRDRMKIQYFAATAVMCKES